MLFVSGGLLLAQDTIKTLIITEARVDRAEQLYFELTNVGDEALNLSDFEFSTLNPWNTFPEGVAWPEQAPQIDAQSIERLPDYVLAPGESYVIGTVSDFTEENYARDLAKFGYSQDWGQQFLTNPKLVPLIDLPGSVFMLRSLGWASGVQSIPGTAYRVQQGLVEGFVDLGAQARNMHVDDVGLRVEMAVPDVLQQHHARDDLVLVLHQVSQQLELSRLQVDLLPAARHFPGQQIQVQVVDLVFRRLLLRPTAPDQRFDAGDQLGHRKGFCQIVIGTGLEPDHALVDVAQGAQEQDRGSHARFT